MISAILLAEPVGLVPALTLTICAAVALASACRGIARAISRAPRHRKHGAA